MSILKQWFAKITPPEWLKPALPFFQRTRSHIQRILTWATQKIKANYVERVEELKEIDKQLIMEEKIETVDHNNTLSTVNAKEFRLTGIVCVGLALLFYRAYSLIYLVIAAFIIAMAIENLILFFQKWMKRGFAIGVSYLLLIIFVLSGILVLIPFVMTQLIDLVDVILGQVNEWQNNLQQVGRERAIESSSLPTRLKESLMAFSGDTGVGPALQSLLIENMDQLVSVGTTSIKDASSIAVTVISGFFAAAFKITITFVISIFFSIEKKKVIHFIGSISGHTARTELVLKKLYRKLGSWLEGQILLCITVGLLTWFGLIILAGFGYDLQNKGTLAIIMGLVEFIPYLGPIVGAIPALLVAITQYGLGGLVAVLILYAAVQQLENNVLVPMVMYHALGTSPLVILLCMVIGGTLFGFLGVLLAVPIAVILSILYETYSN